MSIRAIDWVLDHEVKPASLKLVLLTLANYASDTGMAYPSTETIARKTSVSRRSVVEALDLLVEQGWLEDTGKRVGRTKQIKVFRLKWANEQPKDAIAAPLKDAETAPLDDEKGAEIAGKGAKTAHQRVRKLHTEPSEEPSEEPLKEPKKRNQLSKFIDFLIEDPRFDGLDVEAEVALAVEWYKKKNRPVTERLLENWLLHAEQPLEEDEEEVGSLATEDYYSWDGWTEHRRKALLELWPNTAEPPVRWEKMSPSIKEQIEARVKEGWAV
jgi:DNA-binding transcriptional ArsR family regulator